MFYVTRRNQNNAAEQCRFVQFFFFLLFSLPIYDAVRMSRQFRMYAGFRAHVRVQPVILHTVATRPVCAKSAREHDVPPNSGPRVYSIVPPARSSRP